MAKPVLQVNHNFAKIRLTVLLELAEPLFLELNQLLALEKESNLEGVSEKFRLELKKFEAKALGKNLTPHLIHQAHYILCSFIDEMVLQAKFTQKYFWGQHSLLGFFHNDTHGGEKFFLILQEALKHNPAQRDLLELIFVCLAMGFQGKYRIADNGFQELERIYQNIGSVLNSSLYSGFTLNMPKNIKKRISWWYWITHSWWFASAFIFLTITITHWIFAYHLQMHIQIFKSILHANDPIGG